MSTAGFNQIQMEEQQEKRRQHQNQAPATQQPHEKKQTMDPDLVSVNGSSDDGKESVGDKQQATEGQRGVGREDDVAGGDEGLLRQDSAQESDNDDEEEGGSEEGGSEGDEPPPTKNTVRHRPAYDPARKYVPAKICTKLITKMTSEDVYVTQRSQEDSATDDEIDDEDYIDAQSMVDEVLREGMIRLENELEPEGVRHRKRKFWSKLNT
jgi:hypothetical protein